MPKIINQDGETLRWTAVYNRYMSPYEVSCESLRDAIGLLFWGQDNGDLSPTRIVEPNGNVIEGEELSKLLEDYGDTHGG